MKLVKAVIITLSAVLLTGCYTQLEYSQRMNRVTDQKKVDRSPQQQQEPEYTEYAEDDYVPVYYKDYSYVDRWNDCGCNIYNNYNIHTGYNSWYRGYDHHYRPHHFRPYYSWNPHYRWSYHHRFGHRYYGSSFGFSLHWGSSMYDPFFYDPFYYDRYAYGFSPLARNYFIFYGQPGQGYYGGTIGNKGVIDQNRSYRPRSIGSSRVSDTNRTRSRSAVGRQSVTRGKANTTIRTRSTGTTRSRGTVTRSKSSSGSSARSRGSSVTRSRGSSSSGSSSSGTRTRSRSGGNLQSDAATGQQNGTDSSRSRTVRQNQGDQRQPQVIRYRSLNLNSSNKARTVESRSRIQNRLRNQTAPKVKANTNTRSRSFFDRMKGVIKQGSKQLINSRNSSNTIRLRSRTSGNRSSVTRSKSSGNRSSVTRSRSSSNNSSKSTSSRSRSSSSSGSDRSRGN